MQQLTEIAIDGSRRRRRSLDVLIKRGRCRLQFLQWGSRLAEQEVAVDSVLPRPMLRMLHNKPGALRLPIPPAGFPQRPREHQVEPTGVLQSTNERIEYGAIAGVNVQGINVGSHPILLCLSRD